MVLRWQLNTPERNHSREGENSRGYRRHEIVLKNPEGRHGGWRYIFIGLTQSFRVLFLLSVAVFGYAESGSMTISMIEDDPVVIGVHEVVRTAYSRMGIPVVFRKLSGKRALIESNSGETDGELVRIKGTEDEFTNLIRIPVPLLDIQGVVYTKTIDRDIRSWDDLKGLKVGIIRGIQYSEKGTQGLQRYYARNVYHLFKLLDTDWIDVAVVLRRAVDKEIERTFRASNIHIIGKPLYKAPLYHFIHKRHLNLVPRLEAVLREMKETGEMQAIIEKYR